jgi:sugar O-acyltransferase (sialic acid O-acetyltransferase NeuD family)
MKKVAIVGFDLEVLELLESKKDIEVVGYIDFKKSEVAEIQYLGTDDDFLFDYPNIYIVLSVDIPEVRNRLYNMYKNQITDFIVHHTASISKRSIIEKGTLIQAHTLVSSFVKIGKGCFINHNASIHHESIIGDFTIVAPRATVLGRVIIGKNCYIGAGSIIKQNIHIGSNVTIGAGAVVINDIPDNVTVVGNPAKRILKGKE